MDPHDDATPLLTVRLDGREELRHLWETELSKGRLLLSDAQPLGERQTCRLQIAFARGGLIAEALAEAVWNASAPATGVGLQLLTSTEELGAHILPWLGNPNDARSAASSRPPPSEPSSEPPSTDLGASAAPMSEAGTYGSLDDDLDQLARPSLAPNGELQRTQNLYDRIRRLPGREREALARQGQLAERVALERCYGSAVWESLLQNSLLTTAEVARIARNGALPKPLVGVIVANAGWIARGEVQRALLSNPRVTGAHLDRVLRALSRPELQRIAQQSNYPMAVRLSAKRLLGGG